jgi:UDP-N-acetylmuramate--alanine ligase
MLKSCVISMCRTTATENAPDAQPISDGAGRRVHLIGVGGSGMRALAEYLVDAGWRVSGSDRAPTRRARTALKAIGVDVAVGHDAGNLGDGVDLVVHSAAVPESNLERVAAAAKGIVDLSYPQMLGRCTQAGRSVAVAGTHGKTTTTAMLGWVLRAAGWNPSVICGGELIGLGRAGWHGAGELLVLEACEYQRHFLELRPQCGAVLNVEPDHFDSYPDLDSAADAYCQFVVAVPAEGAIVLNAATPAGDRLANAAVCSVESYGVNVAADWSAVDVHSQSQRVRFKLLRAGRAWADVELSQPGRHNVANAVAAAVLAARLGVAKTDIVEGLRTFPGVRRRLEVCGRCCGVLWLDDYAHHPTAVRAALTAAREEFDARRVWCAFQPHQVSRTVLLMDEFVDALRMADEILLAPVYAARESGTIDPEGPAHTMVQQLVAAGVSARFVPTLDRIVATLETEPRPGDVVVVLGAGDIERVCDEFTGRIRKHHAS